jgi:hypothetical protein
MQCQMEVSDFCASIFKATLTRLGSLMLAIHHQNPG